MEKMKFPWVLGMHALLGRTKVIKGFSDLFIVREETTGFHAGRLFFENVIDKTQFNIEHRNFSPSVVQVRDCFNRKNSNQICIVNSLFVSAGHLYARIENLVTKDKFDIEIRELIKNYNFIESRVTETYTHNL